jgi:hypothetical protein
VQKTEEQHTNNLPESIVWDIKIENSDSSTSLPSNNSLPPSSLPSHSTTLLDDSKFRRNFVNDLREIESFLIQRKRGFFLLFFFQII